MLFCKLQSGNVDATNADYEGYLDVFKICNNNIYINYYF